MGILKFFDEYRKKIMPKIMGEVGDGHFEKYVDVNKQIPIKKILICRPNHRLGNLLLTTPLIQELENTFQGCEIDIIVKGGLSKIIFREYHSIRSIIILPRKPFNQLFKYIKVWVSVYFKKYDLVINAVDGSSSGRLLTKAAKSLYKIFGDFDIDNQELSADFYHISKRPIYNLRHYLNRVGHTTLNTEIGHLDLRLTDKELIKGQDILNELVGLKKPTLAIFTYATAPKCYSKSWWSSFYKILEDKFANTHHLLEILPIENISQIDFKTTTYYSKDVREICSVIAHCDLFIGADSGMMHLASASKTTTIGLFSETDDNEYGTYGNESYNINTNESEDLEVEAERMRQLLL